MRNQAVCVSHYTLSETQSRVACYAIVKIGSDVVYRNFNQFFSKEFCAAHASFKDN
jgi:hypothetical protein